MNNPVLVPATNRLISTLAGSIPRIHPRAWWGTILTGCLLVACAVGAQGAALVRLAFNENTGTTTANSGSLGGLFQLTTPRPAWTLNAPPGGVSAIDYGTTVGNFGVDAPALLPGLGNLSKFTITGWLNNRSTTTGSGGNRVARWFVNGGHGVDLVYRNDGSLDLGVNAFANSSARSTAGRITTSSTAATNNWRFFAVTYDSTLASGQVRFYFGSPTADAVLDRSANLAAGPVGPSVGILTVGAVNPPARATATDRMFRGLMDDITIFDTALTPAEIVGVQRNSGATVDIVAVDPIASEPGADTGAFRITRSGATTTPLTVSLLWGGSAVNGTDYQLQPGTATIPAGASSVDVTVTAIDDTVFDPETISATLQASATYKLGIPSNAVVNLLDNEPGPIYDALEIFSPAALTLAVPPVNFTGVVENDTRAMPAGLPVGTVALVVIPGATVQQINVTGAGREFVLDTGAEVVRVYTSGATRVGAGIGVGSVVRVVGNRTIAPGPIVAEVVTDRGVAVNGLTVAYLYQGVVSQATASVWTVGGVDFAITTTPIATDIALDTPLVVGTSVVTVEFLPNALVPPPGPTPPSLFDALEIFPPAALTLDVPPPLSRNPRSDFTPVPAHLLAPGTICLVVIPGGTVLAINTDSVTGGQEWVIQAGSQVLFVYSSVGTAADAGLTVGSVVRIVANRTVRPGPIVAEVIRARPSALPEVAFAFLYQGIVTRADLDVWTVGGVDFNIVPPTGAFPTAIDLLEPPVLGTTLATVEFTPTPGLILPPPSTVTLAATDASADEFGVNPGTFTITRTTPTNLPLQVFYQMTGTASNGQDYATLSGTVTIPPGVFSVDVAVNPVNDFLREPTETVVATLVADPLYYSIGAPAAATVNLLDDDTPPTITVSAADPAAAESALDQGLFTITRGTPLHQPLVVNYRVTGTASNGQDYAALSGSVIIPAETASVDLTVLPVDDLLPEGSETVVVTLLTNAAYFLGTPTNATVTIADDDIPPTVTITAPDALAAETGPNTGLFTITRTIPTNQPLTVTYRITGTASNGLDYGSLLGTVVIPAAAHSVDILVTPVDDAVQEPTETVIATLQTSVFYVLGTPTNATVTIADDDAPSTVTITAPDAAAAEAGLDGGMFTITRTVPTNQPLTVTYRITGTASNGLDYAGLLGTVVIPVAAHSVDIPVVPADDTVAEASETVIATLQAGASYVLGTPTNATVIIADNDAPPFPQPLVQLNLNEGTGTTTANSGTLGGVFTRSAPTPAWTVNVPPVVGGASAIDYGTTFGNFGVDSPGVLAGLGNLTQFTITGWLNNRSTSQGSGGNRIVRNFVNGAHGIDLVYRNDGSLDLGINEFPNSTARSTASRIPTSSTAAASNWRFFAVTYDSTLAANQVRYFFGSATADAALDVSRTYARGAVGPNVGALTIGHVNVPARSGALDRMFRGLIDEVRIFGTVLTPTELVSLQRGTAPLASPRLVPSGASVPFAVQLTTDAHQAILRWTAVPGAAYRIEYKDDLQETEWQMVADEVRASEVEARFEDALGARSQRFYRVLQLP